MKIVMIFAILLPVLIIGVMVGHYGFPITRTVEVEDIKLSKTTTSNNGLSVNMTPSMGTVIITGLSGNLWWGRINNTDSMFPTMRNGEVLVESVSSTSDIKIRDIIVFVHPLRNENVAHRVASIGGDSEGWYADTLADNKDVPNGVIPYRVRFSQILGKVRVYFDY